MKNILVTGGAGFIGSNFIRCLLTQDIEKIINLDLLTYAGNLETIADISEHPNYQFIQGDICDLYLITRLIEKYKIDTIINFAAESHVDRSIQDPSVFMRSNVLGTQTLLEAALNCWGINRGCCRQDVCFLQVSTDEVYGALGSIGKFTEETPLAPNSPYSASKASADMMVRAYGKTFDLPIQITRCSNNYGPYQYPEKLIPLMIYKCKANQPLPIYGDGLQIRDWLHVFDHCQAILAVLAKGRRGEIYNIGGNNEMPNIDIVRLILSQFGKDEQLIEYVEDRLGHDRRYAIDNTKITRELGWHPKYSFEQGLNETIQWYDTHQKWLDHVMKKSSYSL